MTTQQIINNSTEEAIKNYIQENTNDSFRLLEAIEKGLDCDNYQEFITTLIDISEHGIDGGYGCFIYDDDILNFYNNNKSVIDEIASYLLEDIEYTPAVLFDKVYNNDFKAYYTDTFINNLIELKRFVVWAIVESIAHDINNLMYDFTHYEQ